MTTYAQALSQALVDSMSSDPSVFCLGVGVTDSKGIFGTTKAAHDLYPDRVLETPLSENMLTGACIGAALSGMRPVLVHARNDFLFLTMDQLANNAAKWLYMSNGTQPVPITIRAIVGRGWGQGAQHSQALHGLLGAIPGLEVYTPATMNDAYHLLSQAIRSPNPSIVIEHRLLYQTGRDDLLVKKLGSIGGTRLSSGGNPQVTIAAWSYAVQDSLEAADALLDHGIRVDVIDMQTVSPIRLASVGSSVRESGHLVIADIGHMAFGASAELSARVSNAYPGTKISRVGLLSIPTPTASSLQAMYYRTPVDIANAAISLLKRVDFIDSLTPEPVFQGPF
jgi:pyruvate/2-oxoglutarate/acetoin dehydrogenase E1 component